MKIVGINGSPNKCGNTYNMIKYITDEIKSVSKFDIDIEILNVVDYLDGLNPMFCNGCSNPCEGKCMENHIIKSAFEKLSEADGLIIGSPVYFGTVTAPLKVFFDKSRVLRAKNKLINKVGIGVTVGGSKYGGQETTLRSIHDIMLVHGMIVIGDGHHEHDAGHFGVSAAKPGMEDSYALQRMKIIAKRIVDVCCATETIRFK